MKGATRNINLVFECEQRYCGAKRYFRHCLGLVIFTWICRRFYVGLLTFTHGLSRKRTMIPSWFGVNTDTRTHTCNHKLSMDIPFLPPLKLRRSSQQGRINYSLIFPQGLATPRHTSESSPRYQPRQVINPSCHLSQDNPSTRILHSTKEITLLNLSPRPMVPPLPFPIPPCFTSPLAHGKSEHWVQSSA